MIRLTILFTLKPYVDEEAFLSWQTNEYREIGASELGVIHADFGRILQVDADGETSFYQFVATFDWRDRESFERGFSADRFHLDFVEKLKVLSETTLLVSEIVTPDGEEQSDGEEESKMAVKNNITV